MKQAPVLTDKDIKQLLGYLATTGYHPRNRCMLMLSWLTGMRVGELASLKMGDVLTPGGDVRKEIQLKKHQTKGNEARTVLLNSEARKELANFVRSRPEQKNPDAPLFATKTGKHFSANGLCQRFIQLYKAAGLDRATSHGGRRTFITRLAHKGVNVRVLAALSGHRSIQTTMRYIDLNENVLRAAVELA